MRKIGIICAAEMELDPFLSHIKDAKITEKAYRRFYEGTLSGVPVVAVCSGVCRVNAAMTAQILIDFYGVNAIINAGTAGGMAPEVKLFDTVVSAESVYHDVAEEMLTQYRPDLPSLFLAADEELFTAAKEALGGDRHVHFGRMATGESFVADELRDSVNAAFAPTSADMETAGIAHVCYMNDMPFIAVRSITDTAEHEGMGNFVTNCRRASEKSKDAVIRILAKIK